MYVWYDMYDRAQDGEEKEKENRRCEPKRRPDVLFQKDQFSIFSPSHNLTVLRGKMSIMDTPIERRVSCRTRLTVVNEEGRATLLL